MSSLRYGARCLRALPASATKQWPSPAAISPCIRFPRTIPQRSFTTTLRRQDKDLWAKMEESEEAGDIAPIHARPLPLSPSYFTRHPRFNDSYVHIQNLLQKYGRLPTLPKSEVPIVPWRTKTQYRLMIGEHVNGTDFVRCLSIVKKLHQIHPDLMPEEVKEGIRPFMRDVNHYLNKPKEIPLDRFGRAHGVGRRKSSSARAWVVEGTGEIMVNGKPLSQVFGRVYDRDSAVWGLKMADRLDKYNVWATVSGGGTTGQAEALALAIGKALVIQEPPLKTILKKAGVLTRDPRRVERKKPGHLKARKSPAWVKR
ncbi:40S ribosomal protein S9 [Xylariaceae sp. FL0594]|nr:40S ribosomal protein S9 [Xylariaceae sp. FL0594]